MKISVIIPTSGASGTLLQTVQSLRAQNFPEYEIIVVDNGESDKTKALLLPEPQPPGGNDGCSFSYIREARPGLHNARHAGAQAARGEVLLYIDDDVVADENLLSEILKPYEDPTVVCVGGKIMPRWEIEPPDWINIFPKSFLSILDDDGEVRPVTSIYGCNFSIRKEWLFKLGGFNPDAFSKKEMWWMRGDGEMGLLKKAIAAGGKIMFTPRAVVYHLIPKERLTLDYYQNRAFRFGVERSFAWIKYICCSIPSKTFLLLRTAAFLYKYAIFTIRAKIFKAKGDLNRFYYFKVWSSYYQGRAYYEWMLCYNNVLRNFIEYKDYF